MHDRHRHAIRRFGMAIGIALIAVSVLGTNPARCHAQQPGPGSQQLSNPPVSPFLNLAQPGLNPAITYGAIIQPELQLRNTLINQQNLLGVQQTQLGNLTQQLQQPQGTLQSTLPLATGHKSVFLDTGSYFFPISRGPRQGR